MISTNQLLTKAQPILVETANQLHASDPHVHCKIEIDQHSFLEVSSLGVTAPREYIDRILFEIDYDSGLVQYDSGLVQLLTIERQNDQGCIRCWLRRRLRSSNSWSNVPYGKQLMAAIDEIRQVDPDVRIIL